MQLITYHDDMRLSILLNLARSTASLMLVMIVIAACASEQTSQSEDADRFEAENTELREEVVALQEVATSKNHQLEQARTEAAKSRARSSQLEHETEELRQAIQAQRFEMEKNDHDLERKLIEARNAAEVAEARSIELEQTLDEFFEMNNVAAAAPSEEPRDLEFYLEDTVSADMEAYDMASREPAADGERVVYGDVAREGEPSKISLFYGTNRARTDHTLSDFLRPFLAPFLAIIALVALIALIRLIVKIRYQRPAKFTVTVAFFVIFVWLTLDGLFKVIQMRQADQLNPVQYGPLRLEVEEGSLPFELGTCTVSIPPGHVPGNVELPDITHFEFRSDPAEHFVLSGISPIDPSGFYSKLQARIAQSDDQDMFVFVHGFHNTFQDAAFRTAQIAHDLEFSGAPVFFSWPSQGKVLNYAEDENNVGVAVSDLKLFLQQLRDQSGAERIHLIAHSMGSRALTDAIAAISSELGDGPVFNEMVLAAPDIDAKRLDQMAEAMARVVDRVTLYASSKDEALAASRFVHGQTYQRAGETEPQPLVNDWIQTIDVSFVTSGHSYISDSGRVLSDLDELITRSRDIDETVAIQIPVGDGHYWQLIESH